MKQDQALPVPRLPVLGWHAVTTQRRSTTLPAVTDGPSALFVSAGRAALFLALESLGVRSGDKVLVPSYHCPTMVAPIARLGATPVFYPIDASAAVDLGWLSKFDTGGVKVLLAVHFFGLPQSMSALRKFCDSRGVVLIEDCAHAFFGASPAAGVGQTGGLTIASLPKFFPVMEGGCLVGPSDQLKRITTTAPSWLDELRSLVDCLETGAAHGRFGVLGGTMRALTLAKRSMRKTHDAKPAELAAEADADGTQWLDEGTLRRRSTAVSRWIVRHSELTRLVERRRANYALWSRLTEGMQGAEPLFPELPRGAVPYVFPLRVRQPEAKYRALRAHGVPMFRWDIAWPGIPDLPGDEGRAWLTEVFQLGCHQDLSESDIHRLAAIVRRTFAADGDA